MTFRLVDFAQDDQAPSNVLPAEGFLLPNDESGRGQGSVKFSVLLKPDVPDGDVVGAVYEQDLLCVAAGENVVRFIPPLIVTREEIDEALARFERALAALAAKTG